MSFFILFQRQIILAYKQILDEVIPKKFKKYQDIVMKENWRPKVCMTGFAEYPAKYQFYVQTVAELGGTYYPRLSDELDVLIIRTVYSDKYRATRMRNKKIIPVTENWLLNSKKEGRFQDPEKYRVTQYFLEVTIGLHGFTQQQKDMIEEVVQSQHGNIVKIAKLQTYFNREWTQEPAEEPVGQVDLVLVSNREIKRVGEISQMLTMPVVGVEWLKRCVDTECFVDPRYYAINNEQRYRTEAFNAARGLKDNSIQKLQEVDQDEEDGEMTIFQGVVAYVYGMQEHVCQQFRQLISIHGGFFVTEFGSIVTHLIIDKLDEKDYARFTKYGERVRIVRSQWVFDSILMNKMAADEEYKPLRCRPEVISDNPVGFFTFRNITATSFGAVGSAENSIGFNTFSFNNILENPINSLGAGGLDMRRSISISIQRKTSSQRNKPVEVVSRIFKNHKFFIIPAQKKDSVMQDMSNKIRSYGGQVISQPSPSLRKIYVVMNDSIHNAQHMKSYNHCQNVFSLVSYRWVNQCVNKTEFIDPEDRRYYVFRPFFFNTPFNGFLSFKFLILGFDEVTRLRIRELLEVVARAAVIKCSQQVTHAISEESTYRSFKGYEELKKKNPNAKFIPLSWVLESLRNKKIVPIEPYLLE